jgi:hypothetical protein
MDKYLIGGLVVSLLINTLTIWLLFKKQTTYNKIANLKQKNKRNKGSNIDNDISAKMEAKESKKGLFKNREKRLLRKSKNK